MDWIKGVQKMFRKHKKIIRKGDRIIVDDKILFLLMFSDSACYIFAENDGECLKKAKTEFPGKILIEYHISIAGSKMDLTDVDTSAVFWQDFIKIKETK